ncbi:hypothetical protein CBS9595_002514 [Malassezia furfur]|nr:hypothetical protein CBS9595_002514 [Malassezia furfur]
MFWAAQRAASVPRALRRLTRAYSSESSEPAVATELIPPVAPVKPTDGVHVATLQLKSYNQKTFDLDFFADFALRCAQALEIPTGGIASLPTRTSLWTVPRGPFVHKKSQENFWRRTHRRSIKVYDASDATVDRWLQFLRMHEMPGVASKVSLFRRYPLGIGKKLDTETLVDQRSEQAVREMAEEILRSHMKA